MAEQRPVRTAVLTGAASGIGLGLVKHLLASTTVTWRVVMADINEDAGLKFMKELSSQYSTDRVTFIKTDVASWDANVTLFEQAYKWTNQRIDLFAANAGIAVRLNLHRFTIDEPLTKPELCTVDVNLLGCLYGYKCFLYHIRKARAHLLSQKSGEALNRSYSPRLVFTASVNGLYGSYAAPIYASTKSFLITFMRSIAKGMLKQDGLYVNCIAPGFVDTAIFPQQLKDNYPSERKTPIDVICKAYDELIAGVELEDVETEGKEQGLSGTVIETSADRLYQREKLPYSDDNMRTIHEELFGPLGDA